VPRVSVIIPSRDGYRDGHVPRLLASLDAQSFRDFEVHLIKGVFPQGRAINEGAAQAEGEYLVICDDDARLADETVLQRLVDALAGDEAIGMAGASILVPPEAGRFQQRAARQFPRFNMPAVDTITDSDFACHGCCAFPKRVFDEVGGEREDIIRGLDPDLRVRLRDAGYRVVLVPGAVAYHPLPSGWRAVLRLFFRNGFGSAYAQKFHRDSVYETHESVDVSNFKPRNSFAYRVARYPIRLARAAATGQAIRLVGYCSYACGYCWGALTAREDAVGAGR
jgi:GT2 family glycosyltransferase